MKIDLRLKCQRPLYSKLLQNGFQPSEKGYIFRQELSDPQFYVEMILQNFLLEVKVFDKAFDDEYLPFSIQHDLGNFAAKIKTETEQIVDWILMECFIAEDWEVKIFSYVKEIFDVDPLYPWSDEKGNAVFKNRAGKWFGLLIRAKAKTIGIDKEEKILLMNLKNKPEKITELIDYKTYFPAYHMNKKYWISVLLTPELDETELYQLINESYQLVESAKKTR